jgi:hypothetical protein
LCLLLKPKIPFSVAIVLRGQCQAPQGNFVTTGTGTKTQKKRFSTLIKRTLSYIYIYILYIYIYVYIYVYKSVFKGYRLSLRSVCSRFTLHKIHEHCLSFMQKMQQTDCSNPVINKPSLRNPGTKKQNKRKRAPQTKRRGGEGKTNKKKTRKEGPKRPNSYIYICMACMGAGLEPMSCTSCMCA